MTVTLHQGDCLDVMRQMAADGLKVDSIVTDPPYHLTSIVKRFGGKNAVAAQHGTDGLYARASAGFMGKQWDGGDIAFRVETWRLALSLLKPGAHIFAFSGTRTYHRMAVAIEDAGFIIRDQFGWAYGSGFPKSHNIGKAIDRAAGAERTEVIGSKLGRPGMAKGGSNQRSGFDSAFGGQLAGKLPTDILAPATEEANAWDGWGTCVKPAWEPLCLGQKPVEGTIAANVLKYGTGGLNIDGCRIGDDLIDGADPLRFQKFKEQDGNPRRTFTANGKVNFGRFPANFTHDGSPEVLACFPDSDGQQRSTGPQFGEKKRVNTYGDYGPITAHEPRGDSGSAARFFYTAKADAEDRWGSKHPTVKPVDLIRWYARLITPPGGIILDPFAGSGTLGVAAMAEGFDAILIEREPEYAADIRERIAFYEGEGRHSMASKNRNKKPESTPMLDLMQAAE